MLFTLCLLSESEVGEIIIIITLHIVCISPPNFALVRMRKRGIR